MATHSSEKQELIREVSQILETQPYASISSPTERAVIYTMDQQKDSSLPFISGRQLIELTKCHRNKYYQKLARMAKGLPYDDIIKDRFIHDEEAEEIKRMLIEAAKNGACKTLKEAIKMVSDVVGNRRIDVQFGKTMSESAMRRWLIKNGFLMSKPLTSYQVKSTIDHDVAAQFFTNIQSLVNRENYPLDLIFNMDECWVCTEKKQIRGTVIHIPEIDPISYQAEDGSHVTLIGCIAASGRYVEPCYIIPSELRNRKMREEYLLDDIQAYVNRSGYMTGIIFSMWITDVLIPHINKRRANIEQHALLICDAHVSRVNEDALEILRRHNIDFIILPAHSTSKLQPLDVGIYASYKQKFRTFYKGKGGLYKLLYASKNAFQCSFFADNIRGAWKQSRILDKDVSDYLSTLSSVPEQRKSRIDYANRILVSRHDFYIRSNRIVNI